MEKDNIYQEYGDFIFRYLLTLTHNIQVAEELTQETFYQVLRSIDNYHPHENAKFSTWLCSIAKNVWLQELHREKKKRHLVEELSDDTPLFFGVEEEYIRNEDKIHFFKTVQQLSETKREIVYLRLLGDLSFKEIGSIFGKTENWARVTFYRAKQQMRKGGKLYES
ncbi:RNA polymerase subunit sigma-24 [Bacillaceae bacterium SAOS 7]|nr:RNA polymerase subunit sigma-24 [Bacillaceae bacterium SAOS 7]